MDIDQPDMTSSHFRPADAIRPLLDAIVESSDDAIVARDAAGVIVLWSPGAERMYGYAQEEILGRSIGILVPDDKRAEFDDMTRLVAAGRPVPPTDTCRLTKDGRRIDIVLTITPVADAEGRVIGAVAVGRDITEQRRADFALRRSEARWRAVIDSAVDGILVIDRRGRLESFNPAAERLFGYRAEEVLGQNVSILMPEPYATEHDGYLRRYLETRDPRIIGSGRDVTGRRRDGSTFPLHLSVAEASIEGETKFTGIVRDLTDRVAMEVQLRHESGLARIGELAAVLAHEVKNPLAAVSGAIQMLAGLLPPEGEEQRVVEEVLQRIDGLSNLMSDLLLYARPPQPSIMPIDVAELLQSVVSFLKADPAWQGVDVALDGKPARIAADPHLVKIALQNLLMNAMQAMRGRGTIGVIVSEVGHMAHVDVVDSGPGMSAAVQARVFTPFFTTKARGTGLGLATVRRIAESHSGAVSILRTSASGTAMRLSIPLMG